MGLITPIPMPQEYKIGAQSGQCNTQVQHAQTILDRSSWSFEPRMRQSTRTIAAGNLRAWASKSDRAIKKSALATSVG